MQEVQVHFEMLSISTQAIWCHWAQELQATQSIICSSSSSLSSSASGGSSLLHVWQTFDASVLCLKLVWRSRRLAAAFFAPLLRLHATSSKCFSQRRTSSGGRSASFAMASTAELSGIPDVTSYQSSSQKKSKRPHPGALILSQTPEGGEGKRGQMPHICPGSPPSGLTLIGALPAD